MDGELKPGTLLFNKYLIEGIIGIGGLGAVYKARDTRLYRPVAIKTLLYGQSSLELRFGSDAYGIILERFQREAKITGYFTSNKHIIAVYALEEDDRANHYLILEYLEGGSLKQLIAHEGALGIKRTCALTQDICRALAAIHNHPDDIVHRDLKPDNILLRADGTAVVADFGIAQIGHSSHRTVVGDDPSRHPGTPAYKSPEQTSEYDYLTPASDLYSLGLIMYEMLTGKLYLKFRIMPPSQLNPEIPDWLDAIVVKLLQKEPEDRYQRAEEVASALQLGLVEEARRQNQEQITEPIVPSPPKPPIKSFENKAEADKPDPAQDKAGTSEEQKYNAATDLRLELEREAGVEPPRPQQAQPRPAARPQPRKEEKEEEEPQTGVNQHITDLLALLGRAEAQADLDEIIRVAEQILRLNGQHSQARNRAAVGYYQRGLGYLRQNRLTEAIKDFNRAIELNPNEPSYQVERCQSWIKNGDYDQALVSLNFLIRQNPNEVEYYYLRGMCYYYQRLYTGKGDFEWAIADYRRAISFDPGNPEYYWRRGNSYAAKEDYQQAIADYNRAIELQRNNGQYYFFRSLVYHALADYPAYQRDLRRAADLGYEKARRRLANE